MRKRVALLENWCWPFLTTGSHWNRSERVSDSVSTPTIYMYIYLYRCTNEESILSDYLCSWPKSVSFLIVPLFNKWSEPNILTDCGTIYGPTITSYPLNSISLTPRSCVITKSTTSFNFQEGFCLETGETFTSWEKIRVWIENEIVGEPYQERRIFQYQKIKYEKHCQQSQMWRTNGVYRMGLLW